MDVLHLFPFLLVFWISPVLSAQDVVSIPAEPGQNINLTCRATKNSLVTVLRLTRDDPKQQKEVFLYRNGKINEKSLNPQFKGRISLQSLSTADGEVSVTLSNVTKEDNGTYRCKAVTKEGRLETIIQLHVDPPGNNGTRKKEGENKYGSDGPAETWLQQEDYVSINEATPSSYLNFHIPRSSGRGGGVATIFQTDLLITPKTINTYNSFEHLTLNFPDPVKKLHTWKG